MERMKDLVRRLNEASRLYYGGSASIMSDYEYDKLYDELAGLERATGVILSGSPTQRVGYTVLSGLEKVRHEHAMLSLDKTKETDKLESFLAPARGLLSWKLDGLTVALFYKDGELVQAATRGNGEIGEDITHNARVFKNVPIRIDYPGELRVRGEAVITFADFEQINSRLTPETQYKNPRNLCSGTVRQLNSEITAARSVRFFAFTALGDDGGDSKFERLKWLESLGFDTVESRLVTAGDVAAAVEDMKRAVSENPYATDGLVLTYDSVEFSRGLGATSKFPKDSIAFKWSDELAETRLMAVEWSTSRTGLINPVAVFEPVELEGTTVNRASLHNVSIFEELRLGRGDLLTVYKANMIIPQVAENLSQSATERVPGNCGVCGFEAEVVQVNEGRALYCTNPNCKARLVSGLAHFVSRDAMNIEGLSEATIEKFVAKGFLEDYSGIYKLGEFADEIKQMEGFGEKSTANLLNAIENSKKTALPNFIYALGINQVGLSNAKLLCKHFDYDMSRIRAADEAELLEIAGFGGVIARSLYKYFADERNSRLIDVILPLLSFEIVNSGEGTAGSDIFNGLTFVITGELLHFKNRGELRALIESAGGKVSGSVSSKTSYLINNDAGSVSSKNKKAAELNVTVITEDEFRQKFL